MNIYDIAKKAGVSPATVSRVINNSANVSKKNRELVQSIIERESYIPNVFARGLNLNSIKTIGILCPVIDDLNHARAVAIVERLLREQGFDSLLCCTGSNAADKEKYLQMFINKRVDAIIVIGTTTSEAADGKSFEQAAKHLPIVVINGLVKLPNVYCVLCDERTAVQQLVEGLYAQGHEKILYITDSPTYSAHQKLLGYRDGLAACGLTEQPDLVMEIPDNGHETCSAYERTACMIEGQKDFTAIIGCDDTVAIGALKALGEHQLHMPVIGFNNSDFTFCSTPSLTSVDNGMETLARSAVNILMNVFKGEDAIMQVVIKARLVERQSAVLNLPGSIKG